MSLYSRFGAAWSDVLAEFPGAAAEDFAGPAGGDGQARLEAAMDAAEQLVVAGLPPHLRRMLDRVEGAEIVAAAAAGQDSAALPLTVAAAPDLVLWRDWPPEYWPLLPDRAAALPEGDAWTRSGQTVSLQPGWELAGGENLLASWNHAAAASDAYLASLLVGLARALLAARLYRPGEAGFEAAESRRRWALEELGRLRAGQADVPAFARLTLVSRRGGRAEAASGRSLGRA